MFIQLTKMLDHVWNLPYLSGKHGRKTMQYGTVKMWNSAKGFGFIVSDDDEELFVHAGDLHITVKDKRLHEGQRVGFDMRQEMKGDKAINVRVVG